MMGPKTLIDCACSYLNLPIGGLTLAACAFLLPSPKPTHSTTKQRAIQTLKSLDFVGTILVLGALMMMLMALYVFLSEHPDTFDF